MLLAASPTTPSAARRAATPVEASLATAAVVVAAMVAAAVAGRGRCSPLCAPTVAMTPRCRSARAVTGRSTAAIVSVACETKRGVVPLFAGVLKHLAVHSLTMAARCTFWFGPGGLEGIQVPLWQFQGFCVDLTHWTWSKCRFADAMLAASHRMAAGRGSIVTRHYGVVAYVGTAVHAGWREASPLGVSLLPAAFFRSPLAPRVMPCFRRHCPGGSAESAVPCCWGVGELCAFAAYWLF